MAADEKWFQDPRRGLNFGVGVFSPLWSAFVAAASAGVAFWAWTQWGRRTAPAGFPQAGPEPETAPPAATEATPPADLPEPVAPEPAERTAAVVAEPVANQLDESLAVQAPAEPVPPENAEEAEKGAAPVEAPFVSAPPPSDAAPVQPSKPPKPKSPSRAAARKKPAVDIEPPRPHTVIEAVAPEAPAKAPSKARALASAATPVAKPARSPKAAGAATASKRRTPPKARG